ncbi:MAG: adenylate kinase [Gemmatimonadota bacterium]|nr:adenylate kinase [Gemmatimonadota bacterium]
MNLILLGAPGSGKGTQGALLSTRLNIPKIATGDLIRTAMKDGTPLGTRAKEYYDQGLLVPDEIILGLIEEVLQSPGAKRGVIMDGFPRTSGQAEAVDRLLHARGQQVDRVLLVDVPEEELVRRMRRRAALEGRSDDTIDAFRRRLGVYREQTAPLVAYYRERDLVSVVPGIGTVEDIAERVKLAVGR